MYDFFLGGFHNLEVDREAARAAEAAWPGVARSAQANRSFLRRAVAYLVEAGIDQFLDLGSGVPSVGAVHEAAHAVRPEARVVYVENEPVAVQASRMVLTNEPRTAIVPANLLDPESVFEHPETQRLLDFDRPVAVMLVLVLHFVRDEALAASVIRRYREALAPGSFIAFSHVSDPSLMPAYHDEAAGAASVIDLYNDTGSPVTTRTLAQLTALLDGLELVPPGLVHVLDWRPDGDTSLDRYRDRIAVHGAVGRVP
jgi:hypothetical protein